MQINRIEKFIRLTANNIGLDISRYRPENTPTGHLAKMLNANGIDFVFDIGANKGQFSQSIRAAGYRGQILSFEPLQDAHLELCDISQNDDLWNIALPMAIGDEDGDIELNISENSVSSSSLEMHDTHKVAAPSSAYIGVVTTPVRRLDTLALSLELDRKTIFIKIDTQGSEDRVLDGATETIAKASGLQLELSLTELYVGQSLYHTLLERVTSEGFDLWGLWPGFTDPTTGRMLQVDAVFFRRPDLIP